VTDATAYDLIAESNANLPVSAGHKEEVSP